MGRSGYNSTTILRRPKREPVYHFQLHEQQIRIPGDSYIVEAGEGLTNEKGGIQAEIGYIIVVKRLKPKKTSKPAYYAKKAIRCIRNYKPALLSATKDDIATEEYIWVAASLLIQHAPRLAWDYHSNHPTAPTPYRFRHEIRQYTTHNAGECEQYSPEDE